MKNTIKEKNSQERDKLNTDGELKSYHQSNNVSEYSVGLCEFHNF